MQFFHERNAKSSLIMGFLRETIFPYRWKPCIRCDKKMFKLNENFYQKTAVATFIDQDRF